MYLYTNIGKIIRQYFIQDKFAQFRAHILSHWTSQSRCGCSMIGNRLSATDATRHDRQSPPCIHTNIET